MILTGFQLRTSRQALNLTLEQLHQESNVSKVTLSRLENTISNLEDINPIPRGCSKFFEVKKIIKTFL